MDTLTRMRAFIDVVEAEGYSAASRKIGRSKALLSKYVRELEDELGALLLNRTTRQFSMTEAGQTYYRRASEIIRDIDTLSDTVRDSAGDVKGRIKLTAPRSFADADVGQSLIDFAIAHPDIVLDIRLDDRFVDLVEEGYDLAIRITRLEDSGMIVRKLSSFSLLGCASPAFIEKHGMPAHPADLASLPCVIDTNGRFLNSWRFDGGDGTIIPVTVNGRIEANSPLVALRAVQAGLGVGFIPDFVARPALARGDLVQILEAFTLGDRGIYAVYPHRRYLPAKVRALVDFMAKWFRDHDAAPSEP